MSLFKPVVHFSIGFLRPVISGLILIFEYATSLEWIELLPVVAHAFSRLCLVLLVSNLSSLFHLPFTFAGGSCGGNRLRKSVHSRSVPIQL